MAKGKEITNNDATGKELVSEIFDRYPIANKNQSAEVIDIIKENLGTNGIQIKNLDKITVPSMGDTEFRVDLGEGPTRIDSIRGIILLAPEGNAYWDKPIEEAPGSFPVCYSSDAIYGVGDPFGTGEVGTHKCIGCPKKQWKTDFKARGKACRDLRPIFILREGEYLPIIVQTPRMSLSRLTKYFTMLGRIGTPFYAAITEIGLQQEKKENTPLYSVLTFKLIGVAPKEVWPMLKEYQNVLTGFASQAPTAGDVIGSEPDDQIQSDYNEPVDSEVIPEDADPFDD